MFSAYSRTALNSYRSVGVETGVIDASPQRLTIMLYEGAIAAIASAQQALHAKDLAGKGKAISQAIAIVGDGLKASLDLKVGGALAQNLAGLYDYMVRRLLQANLRNDPAALDEVRQLLLQLLSAWESLAATTTAAAAQPSAAPPPKRAATPYGNI